MTKNVYQFATTPNNGRSVFHCVPIPLPNPSLSGLAPFRTICGLRHDQWSFADKIETAPCKRCFGSLSRKDVMEMYGGVH
jgi:hypothetical protein